MLFPSLPCLNSHYLSSLYLNLPYLAFLTLTAYRYLHIPCLIMTHFSLVFVILSYLIMHVLCYLIMRSLTQAGFSAAAKELFVCFSPRVNFQCRLSYCVRAPQSVIACTDICAHVKDPVVNVRVRWIRETLKHPVCTVGWVALLCRSWLSPGKATRFSYGRNLSNNIIVEKKNPTLAVPIWYPFFHLITFNFAIFFFLDFLWFCFVLYYP